MRTTSRVLVGVLAAMISLGSSGPALAAPWSAIASMPVDVWTRDTASPLAGQDQLAAALATSTQQGHALLVPSGSVTLYRTFWLPVGARLQLGAQAVLTGTVAGQSLVRLQSGSTLTGGTVRNTSDADCFDVDVAGGARGAVIDGVAFEGARTNSVYVNAPDVQDLTIRNSTFAGTTYGVLVNSGALRGRRIVIDRNRFVGTTGDAIEINTPVATAADATRDVTISSNTVSGMAGQGDSSGFGVGIAGVRGYRITGNTLLGVRSEAVHLEAQATNGVVERNVITGGGAGGRPAIAVYRTVDLLQIRRNVVQRFDGPGIAVLWDSIGSSTRITTTRNLVQDVSGDGIVMGGDAGTGPFITKDNAVLRAQNGIVSYGTHATDVVSGNLLRGNRGKNVFSAYQGSSVRTVSGNTSDPAVSVASVVGADVVALAGGTTSASAVQKKAKAAGTAQKVQR